MIQWSSVESAVEQGGVTRAQCVCVCVFRGVSYGEPASEKKKPAGTDPCGARTLSTEPRVCERDERIRADAGVLTA